MTFYACSDCAKEFEIAVENQVSHLLMYKNTFYAGADLPRELKKMDLEDQFFPPVL